MNGLKLTITLRFCIAGPVLSRLHSVTRKAHLRVTDVRNRNINSIWGIPMSALDLPKTARAISVVVAIALVASAMAPVIFTAARVIA